MATKRYVSAGVFIQEKDESFLGPGIGEIGAALIGLAPKGPAQIPVVVNTYPEFAEIFGDLDSDYKLGYAARSYLKNAGTANIVRVLGPAGRTVNGSAVTPGYTAESMWAVTAGTGSVGAVMALVEITGSHKLTVTDLTNDEFFVEISASDAGGTQLVAGTASFLTASANYIGNVLNTDPTRFSTDGYFLREVYNYAKKQFADSNALYSSASYGITNFGIGFQSGSTPWIRSQPFGGVEYNLFRLHTLGHGAAENGRFKISISNIRPSVVPSQIPFGKFDVEIRYFSDTDGDVPAQVFANVTLDPTDSNYISKVIGDKYIKYDAAQDKVVNYGNYENRSKLFRVEIHTTPFPDTALPWGFAGLAKPDLSVLSSSGDNDTGVDANVDSAVADLPLTQDLKGPEGSEANSKWYWGMDTLISGSVVARMSWLPTMTGSDANFSLKNVSGSSLDTFVYNASNPAASQKGPGETLGHTVLTSKYAKFTVPVAFGFDGFDVRLSDPLDNETQLATVSQLGTQALRQAVDVIKDPDFIDINLLAIPGIYKKTTVVDYAIEKMEDRADVFYVPDLSSSTQTTVVAEVRGNGWDTNYAAVYYPGIRVIDDVNGDQIVTVPASVPVIGAIAYNDRVGYEWYAPAGLNRAGLSPDTIGFTVSGIGAEGVGVPNLEDRDELQENRINPITRFPDVPGGVIWGQKTLQVKASALDRVNVRRLLIKAKKLVASAARVLVFEANNASTQTRFRQLVNPILSDIQQKQGLEEFKVVMDATTNPPELIDRNIMAGKVYLIPTRTAEVIALDFIIGKSGATFIE